MPEQENHSPRTEREHERAADPADTANRPLEGRSEHEPLHDADLPHPQDADPHHRLNTHVGELDPEADSDPYRTPAVEDESDRASGVTGEGEDADGR